MSLNCKTPEDVLKAIQDNDVRHVDLRFTDPRGKWQHTAQYVTTMDEDVFVDGIFFDGSSIAGWKGHQRVRHDPDAGPDHGHHGPVHGGKHHGAVLRCA